MRLTNLLAVSLLLSAALALSWHVSRRPNFDDAVHRLALTEQLRKDDSRCPLNKEAAGRSPVWLLSACATGGLTWFEAADKYGGDAEKVYFVYGADPVFQEVFGELGAPVILVISYFIRNGSTQYQMQEALGRSWAHLWGESDTKTNATEVTPEQYGLLAIEELRDRRHEMLSEFEIVNGVAVRKQFTRTIFAAKNFVFSGISDLEQVMARGERLPSWSEIGWASADAVVVAGGVGALAKSLRFARAPAALTTGVGASRLQAARAATSGALRSLITVGKVAGVATIIAVPYLAMTHPTILADAAGWVAEQTGLPGWLGVFVICFCMLMLGGFLLGFLARPILWVIRVGTKLTAALGGGRPSTVATR